MYNFFILLMKKNLKQNKKLKDTYYFSFSIKKKTQVTNILKNTVLLWFYEFFWAFEIILIYFFEKILSIFTLK